MAANFPFLAGVCLGISEVLCDSAPFKLEHNEEKDMPSRCSHLLYQQAVEQYKLIT